MCSFDDRDIKIFSPDAPQESDGDILMLAQNLDRQRGNGNLAKARALGERCAAITPENAAETAGLDLAAQGIDIAGLNASVLYQSRVLMLFTAQLTLHGSLTALLSSNAVNAMYDRLRELSEGFYDNVMEGTSFSFYYLAVRGNLDPGEMVGKNFAMLCGDEDDGELISLGRKIFELCQVCVKRFIDESCFDAS